MVRHEAWTQQMKKPLARLNVHALLPRSRANGPGVRAVIWLQGCERRCPGCFNPDAQPTELRRLLTPDELWQWVQTIEGIEGLTLSGGEPLLQAEALADFLRRVRAESDFSVVLYSGYLREEMETLPDGPALLALVDVLIDGPYDQTRPAHGGIRGSENQRIHFPTDRYGPADFAPAQRVEVLMNPSA
jgi:anaerobic ribonucleoside-triphosphate reductase activating protein